MISVEYLMSFNSKEGQCKDIKSFNHLLSSNSFLNVEGNQIKFNGSFYNYNVDMPEMDDDKYSVFHLTFSFSRNTLKFRKMLKLVKITVGPRTQKNIQLIWDGVSFEWSKDLYIQIYIVENSMRKLLSKFMLINLGVEWYNKAIPQDVKNSIKKSNYKANIGILYEVGFDQLSNFLFKPYPFKSSEKASKLIEKLLSEKQIDQDSKNEILEYIPKNNWDRYFYKILNIESQQLEKYWTKLYNIRCKVAHNKPLDFNDFEEGKKLCKKLSSFIDLAIDETDNIEIPEGDKETIKLNTIGTINQSTADFMKLYGDLGATLKNAIVNIPQSTGIHDNNAFSQMLEISNHYKFPVSVSVMKDINLIKESYNSVISGSTTLNDTNIGRYTDLINSANIEFKKIKPFQVYPSSLIRVGVGDEEE